MKTNTDNVITLCLTYKQILLCKMGIYKHIFVITHETLDI